MSNSRRNFIRQSALAGLALSLPFKNELFAMAANSKNFGIQLWTVKDALYKDSLGVFKHLAASGYKQIESFEGTKGMFWGMKNTEFKKQLNDLGMNIVSSHCDYATNFERKCAEAAVRCGRESQHRRQASLRRRDVSRSVAPGDGQRGRARAISRHRAHDGRRHRAL